MRNSLEDKLNKFEHVSSFKGNLTLQYLLNHRILYQKCYELNWLWIEMFTSLRWMIYLSIVFITFWILYNFVYIYILISLDGYYIC